MDAADVVKAIAAAMRIRASVRLTTLALLADHIDEAAAALRFDHDAQKSIAAIFRELAIERRARDPGHALSRIAARLEPL